MTTSVRRCPEKQVLKLFTQRYLHENLFHGVEESKSSIATRWNDWWTWSGSNRRPLPCHGSALPAAPQAHVFDFNYLGRVNQALRCKSYQIQGTLASPNSGL